MFIGLACAPHGVKPLTVMQPFSSSLVLRVVGGFLESIAFAGATICFLPFERVPPFVFVYE